MFPPRRPLEVRWSPERDAGVSFGLQAMMERAAVAGGELSVESSPGKGMTVRIGIPVERAR